jgi:autotransporter-associated beta strand protein
VEVRQGTLQFGNDDQNLGTGTLTLGVNGGTGAVTARASDNSDRSFANAIVLTSGHTGTITILMTEDNPASPGNVNSKTFTGGITGTNSFTIQNDGGNDNLAFSTTAINNVGAITHTGTGTGVTTINSVIDTNVTGVTQNSATSKMVLAGTNTYSGTTTVQAGTLALSAGGSINSSTTIDVKSGATFDVTAKGGYTVGASQTLKGSGTIKGATTINGILAPGASPGTLTFENALTLANSTVMEIDGTAGAGLVGGHDFVNLTGAALTYGGTMTLDIGTIFGVGTYSWDLFDFASETSGFSGITLADQYSGSLTGSGDSWGLTSGNNTWSFAESTGVLGLTVIPEPGAALLGSLGLLALLRRRR